MSALELQGLGPRPTTRRMSSSDIQDSNPDDVICIGTIDDFVHVDIVGQDVVRVTRAPTTTAEHRRAIREFAMTARDESIVKAGEKAAFRHAGFATWPPLTVEQTRRVLYDMNKPPKKDHPLNAAEKERAIMKWSVTPDKVELLDDLRIDVGRRGKRVEIEERWKWTNDRRCVEEDDAWVCVKELEDAENWQWL